MKDLKNDKIPGVDDIQAVILKSSGEKARDRLFILICTIYE